MTPSQLKAGQDSTLGITVPYVIAASGTLTTGRVGQTLWGRDVALDAVALEVRASTQAGHAASVQCFIDSVFPDGSTVTTPTQIVQYAPGGGANFAFKVVADRNALSSYVEGVNEQSVVGRRCLPAHDLRFRIVNTDGTKTVTISKICMVGIEK